MTDILDLQIKYCNEELFSKNDDAGYDAPDPIFIVGLPRAGSTLLEQILASHSKIEGTLELPNIPSLAYRLAGRKTVNETPDYPKNLNSLDKKLLLVILESSILKKLEYIEQNCLSLLIKCQIIFVTLH